MTVMTEDMAKEIIEIGESTGYVVKVYGRNIEITKKDRRGRLEKLIFGKVPESKVTGLIDYEKKEIDLDYDSFPKQHVRGKDYAYANFSEYIDYLEEMESKGYKMLTTGPVIRTGIRP